MKRTAPRPRHRAWVDLALLALFAISATPSAAGAESPQRGGELRFVFASRIPSFDAHKETTFGVIHPLAPFYSLLLRVNPDNPQASNDLVCDLCAGGVPMPTDGGTRYTFSLVNNARFHDGTPLTAHDVVATFRKIIFPPPGISSARRASFRMVESVSAPDDYTVEFRLKFPSATFLPALASPFNWIYSRRDLDRHGYLWHQDNINGSGPFIFEEHRPSAFVTGRRNPDYHRAGRPYLDGFRALHATRMQTSVQAIRSDHAAIEFRGFSPRSRDALVSALGDRVVVQESDWNCVLLATPNHRRKPFDDPRVRRALSLALDRRGGSAYLSKVTIVRTVGGVVFPHHPLAATADELRGLAGFGADLDASRAEARRLLAAAGAAGLEFELVNRGIEQPYRVVGAWLVDQWATIGLQVSQRVESTPEYFRTLRETRDFDVAVDFNCPSVVNPIADASKYLGSAEDNYAGFVDGELEALYERMLRSTDVDEERRLMRAFERRALDQQAHEIVTLWWHRIVPHRAYVKGWKISPSHHLNQQLENVWIDQSLRQER